MNRLFDRGNNNTPGGIIGTMKLTPANKKILTFMASTPGRWIRIFGGVTLAAVALTQGGASLLLMIPAAMMLTTGIMNYCPMGPLYGQTVKSGELLKKLHTYDMK
jgi:Zn-dependent protease